MSKERYFLETHIHGNELPGLRTTISDNPQNEKHLHVTFVRPFSIKDNAEEVKKKIIEYCKDKKPIPFVLKGKKKFDENISYIPVESNELQNFDTDLEKLLEGMVVFDTKLNEEKILHLTIEPESEPISRTEMAMLRLTCIRDAKNGDGKRIWFSYDFVTQEVLNRDESLDQNRWQETQKLYRTSF